MIGIVMLPRELRKTVTHSDDELSHLHGYGSLAKKYKVDLCFYSIQRIQSDNRHVRGFLYSYDQQSGVQTLTEQILFIPKINLYHNISYVRKKKSIEKIKHLERNRGISFYNLAFNSQRNKLYNHHLLSANTDIKKHLPFTMELTYDNLAYFLSKYDKIIIKPLFGSKGRRMTIIEKSLENYKVHKTPSKKLLKESVTPFYEISRQQLYPFFKKNFQRPSRFLIQEWIPFRKHQGQPFDIRVIVQKNKNLKWQVSSCVARVSASHGVITNLHQGGEMVSFRDLKIRHKRKQMTKLCHHIARAFEQKYPSTADIGIDLAIDLQGQFWFIEANFCCFRERMKTVYQIPFEHAYKQYIHKKGSV